MVFLIALTGIGMDYLIQILTRYRRESARRTSPRGIWTGVFKYVAAPINTACLGAAGAFFVSVFTNFRGAAELGIVASGGLLLCLLTGYVILPPLLTLFPARARPADAERGSDCDDTTLRKQAALLSDRPQGSVLLDSQPVDRPALRTVAKREDDAIAPRRPSRLRHLWLAPPVLWAVLLLIGIHFASRAKFDPSLLKLQAQSLQSVKLVHKLQTWSAAVLEPPSQLDKLRQVRDAVEKLSTVESTDSILSACDNDAWLHQQQLAEIGPTDYDKITPADLPGIAGTATALATAIDASNTSQPSFQNASASLRELANAISQSNPVAAAQRLSAWQETFIKQLKFLLAQFRPPPLDLAALPASLRSHLIGLDGQCVLYIYPRQDLWRQDNLRDFVTQVETAVHDHVPNPPPVTGVSVDVYHSTSSIERSFHTSTAYALGLIFLLVLIDLRNIKQTLLAISVLAMGLPMLVALMGLLHIDWNFANFFGLPILIGAGHEYGVFMVHRYNEAATDCHRRWRAWDVSDKALLLCGYVTSVSFGFFWLLGHHEGLKSLGLVMALGTASIYLATLCVLRPLLLWKLGRTLHPAPLDGPRLSVSLSPHSPS
jgi:hypothetical protein